MTVSVSDVTNAFMLVYAGLFPIINPIGSAPIFLGLTGRCTEKERHALALHVTRNSFLLLLGSLLAGSYVLEFFGLTVPIVRVAGGVLVIASAWKLINAGAEVSEERAGHPPVEATDDFYPLTMPLTVGPGSIAVAITLGSQRPRGEALSRIAILGVAAVAGMVAIAVTIYVCYRFAEGTVTLLGEHGTNALVRLSAFILLCIGFEIMWNGYSALVHVAS